MSPLYNPEARPLETTNKQDLLLSALVLLDLHLDTPDKFLGLKQINELLGGVHDLVRRAWSIEVKEYPLRAIRPESVQMVNKLRTWSSFHGDRYDPEWKP